MNFLKSVFSDDLDPSDQEPDSETPEPVGQNPSPSIPTISSAWTFGSSLMKTLASKSESVIDTYRRDLEEFSSGLKNETAVIRRATSRAVKDLPSSLEAGAGLAQESLESVGQAIDNLGTAVAGIIAHGKDSILAVDYSDTDSNITDANNNKQISTNMEELGFLKPYSRLDAHIRTIQSDMNTYLEDPEDVAEYNEWKLGFKIDEQAAEIENVIKGDNGVVGEIYREIVPKRVDEVSFWGRYFYRIHKVSRAEETRARLVKRAISGDEEEDLSWDIEEDDYEENVGKGDRDQGQVDGVECEVDNFEAKMDKDSDITVVSSQPSLEDDGWDEIEDVGSDDEGEDKAGSSPNRGELRKRLSVAAEEEDLTWDIEDDDDDDEKEPVRA